MYRVCFLHRPVTWDPCNYCTIHRHDPLYSLSRSLTHEIRQLTSQPRGSPPRELHTRHYYSSIESTLLEAQIITTTKTTS
jgi:hypothetical protein